MTAPRLGFVGLGWIGQHRLRSLVEAGAATPTIYLEPDPRNLQAAQRIAPAGATTGSPSPGPNTPTTSRGRPT